MAFFARLALNKNIQKSTGWFSNNRKKYFLKNSKTLHMNEAAMYVNIFLAKLKAYVKMDWLEKFVLHFS